MCGHQTVSDCTPCATDTACDDGNLCTTDTCGASGSCERTTIEDCRPCTIDADCDDDDRCTTDTCSEGLCTATPDTGCDLEVCDDGVDNDGDADTDCGDSDCASDPACATEVCGDCRDNDGDGLVDYEDPDCCERMDRLALRRMVMKLPPKAGKQRLRLRGRTRTALSDGFDPARDRVTLQVADHDGQLYCHDVPLKATKRSLKRGVFRFRDRTGKLAAGLRNARLKIRKNGTAIFRTKGRKMTYRMPKGTDMMVTLRLGGVCTQAPTTMRARERKSGTRLAYP